MQKVANRMICIFFPSPPSFPSRPMDVKVMPSSPIEPAFALLRYLFGLSLRLSSFGGKESCCFSSLYEEMEQNGEPRQLQWRMKRSPPFFFFLFRSPTYLWLLLPPPSPCRRITTPIAFRLRKALPQPRMGASFPPPLPPPSKRRSGHEADSPPSLFYEEK